MRRRWYFLPAALIIILFVFVFQLYTSFVSRNIYGETVEHLEEIYTQVNRTFATLVVKNWRLLDSWDSYIEHLHENNSEEEIVQYISEEINKWGCTEFYFLDEKGNYLTIEGERGYVDLGSELSSLVTDRENIGVDGKLPGGETITVFAIPTEKRSMADFEYSAIAVSYGSEDMEQVININAFSGESNCYVVYSDGSVLFSTRSSNKQPENVLSYLDQEGQLTKKEFDSIRNGLHKKARGNIEYKCEGEARYLVYMPVGFRDWMLIGMVPKDVVGRRLNQVQIFTVTLIAGMFLVVIISGLFILIRRNRKRLNEKSLDIKYREQLFDILSNSVDDIFIIFSKDDYKVEYISPNIQRILGISVEEIKKDIRKLGDLYTRNGEAIPLTKQSQLDMIPLGGCWQHETQLAHHETNEIRWYSETLYQVSISEHEKYIFVLSDRTIEEKKNQALQQALENAESANEAKSNFLFNMSHDIRTPMNAIVGYAMLLGNDADKPEKVREYTRKITASGQHLLGLINDILDMSKIESGNTKLNNIEFSLSELLEELSAVIVPQAKAKEQQFNLRVFSVKNEMLVGDRMRLSQILVNLLSNAVKYTPEGGNIELTIENLSQKSSKYARLRFRVRDDGIGMSEEFLKMIYDPFVRAKNSTMSKIQGTGLGMAITKNLVELMGGSISVESKPGEGSIFTVNLSLKIPNQKIDKNFWLHNGISKVLTVDDEEEICLNICKLMEGTGVSVSYATDGATAVQMVSDAHLAEEDYSIVMIDWKMPKIDGIETARRIRSCVGPDIPILVLTAYDWEEVEEEAREAGIDAFLTKPFFVSGLQQTIVQLREMEDHSEEPKEIATTREMSLKGLNFLVVEDNEINAELLVELLELEGAKCEVAVNGKEALDKFEKTAPNGIDIILMDVQMPVMDGYEATKAIRASSHPDAKKIPIAAMTANAFAEDVENALKSGMNAHIAKPIDMKVLNATVSRLLHDIG